jgi:hypothetical protein
MWRGGALQHDDHVVDDHPCRKSRITSQRRQIDDAHVEALVAEKRAARRQCGWELVLSHRRQLAHGDSTTLEDARPSVSDYQGTPKPRHGELRGSRPEKFPRADRIGPFKLSTATDPKRIARRTVYSAKFDAIMSILALVSVFDLLEGLAVPRGDRMTSWPYSRSCRTASIRSGRAGGLAVGSNYKTGLRAPSRRPCRPQQCCRV